MRRAIVLLVLLPLFIVGCKPTVISPPPTQPATMTRDEFRDKVKVGMTPEEVIAAVGKPTETVEHTLSTTWFYNHKTLDPLTNKIGTATVTFEKRKVASVRF